MVKGWYAWQKGLCVVKGGMCDKGEACEGWGVHDGSMHGGMHGRRCTWQGGQHGMGCAWGWQGDAREGMCAAETATGCGMQPTGMHSDVYMSV